MWIRINIQPMIGADGRITGAVASFSDITAARRAAAELRREEQFLQVLLDTLEEGIVACDAEGRITVFNPAARRLHGLAEESDPIGTIPSDEGLRRADGSPMEPPGESLDPGHVRRAAPRRGDHPGVGGRRPPQGQRQRPGPGRRRRLDARCRGGHARRHRAEAQRGAAGRTGPPRSPHRAGQPDPAGRASPTGHRRPGPLGGGRRIGHRASPETDSGGWPSSCSTSTSSRRSTTCSATTWATTC